MEQQGLKQPLLGILGTVVVFFIAFGIMVWFKPETFLSWVGFLAMTTIPMQIIMALVWGGNYPAPAAKLEQPLKGVYLTLMLFIVEAVIAGWALKTVGGFVTPPNPFLIFFTIMAVISTLFCVIAWQCWPASAIKGHPAFVGFGTLIVSYLLAIALFRNLFDFGFAKGAPFYVAALDPGGAFNAWSCLSFFVTAVVIMLLQVQMDFWPLSAIPPKAPMLGKQPIFGIMASIWIFLLTWIMNSIFVNYLKMDPVVYFVNIAICMIFGQFIMLLLMQTWPVQTLKQPWKGFILVILSIILAVIMNYLYSWFCRLITGGLPSGPPGYVFELWLATSLLGVTFPVIVVYTGLFNFWPLSEPAAPPPGP